MGCLTQGKAVKGKGWSSQRAPYLDDQGRGPQGTGSVEATMSSV